MMNVPYFIVVEEQEFNDYAKEIDKKRILILDKRYQRDYVTCDDLGDTKSKGPGPARNFAWEHSISKKFPFHWVMDDNIHYFYRLNKNLKIRVKSGAIFRAMEDFVLRYENVAMAGPNYDFFCPRKEKLNPFILNTRIYSCNLIRNDTPFRWRGRYNEDTDLSLRMLKAGWCTIQFNAFLQGKTPNIESITRLKGGCTDVFYSKEGTLPKSQIQVKMHPDVSKVVWKFRRWHHVVDYSAFKKNRLRRKENLKIKGGKNEYGMVIRETTLRA